MGGDPAAHLGHQLQQARLAQITALAAGVGPREHQQVGGAFAAEGQIVGGEGFLHQQLLHHRVAARLNHQLAAVRDLWAAVAPGGGHIGEGGHRIQLGHQPGGHPNRGCPGSHFRAQLAKQLVFPLGGPGLELQDLAFPGLELGGDEALLIGQGLAADPVVGHGCRFGPAHRQEVAKGAVVLEFEGGDATGLALERLLAPQPSVLVVELVAQAIELGIDTVVDQAPFTDGERGCVEQVVAQQGRDRFQLGPGLGQGLKGLAGAFGEQGGQLGQALEAIGQGHQIPG